MEEHKWCLVTGGRGFIARHLVEMLINSGFYTVRIADLPPSIDLEPNEQSGVLDHALRSGRAVYVSMDLRDKQQVLKACEGVEAVFHMAAPDATIYNYQLHHSVNVGGTKNIIDACIEHKVKRLIYTSSMNVVFDGDHGITNGDESLPYPDKHNDPYSATKAEGEALVLKANGTNGLLTCCLRPTCIFGPGDKLFIPSTVTAAREGKFKFIIGDGNNMYDITYVENVAHAHVCAERALASTGEIVDKAAGQAYFITNMEPFKFWEFLSLIVEGLGYERPRTKIPVSVMMPIAHVNKWAYKLLAPNRMNVPEPTPARIRIITCNSTFSSSKAKERIGYTPIVSLQEGMEKTINSYSHLRAEQKRPREGPSKAFICLGNGRIANTLLWKDKKQTLMAVVVLIAFYYNFIASGNNVVTAISKLLLLAVVFLFIHGILPERIFGYTIQKVHPSTFQLSEEKSLCVAHSVASSWNTAANVLKSISRGSEGMMFLKIVVSLIITSFIGTFSAQNLCSVGLPVVFIGFFVYEQKEEEIDGLVAEAIAYGCKLKDVICAKLTRAAKVEARQ